MGGIIHPANPHIPAMQFNCRYFEAEDAAGKKMAWFAGIHHLLPYYLVEEVSNLDNTLYYLSIVVRH